MADQSVLSDRETAKRNGEKTYLSDRACGRGHERLRYTLSGHCVECAKQNSAKTREKNPTGYRTWRLRSKYGISREEFNGMLAGQDHRCATCGEKFNGEPMVDHCHRTGNVRALLCKNCNLAIGLANDDPTVLKRMADYVSQFSLP